MSDPLDVLVQQLSKLPGVGARSATRLAFYILNAKNGYAEQLASAITEVRSRLGQCDVCGMIAQETRCRICSNTRRDAALLMVVAIPQDVFAIERAGTYTGRYHVLNGLLSPLDGIGPDDINIRPLLARIAGVNPKIHEVILATSPNVEGDATALYLAKLIGPLGVSVSRIASGVPIGGELEYADGVTLNRAIDGRVAYS